METQQQQSTFLHATLRIAQVVLALVLVSGAVLKFMPIEKIAVMMPWTGELPAFTVRLLGVVDLAGSVGLVLPFLLRRGSQLTFWAAIGAAVLMVCAIAFHVSRGEASVIGLNIFSLLLALFIARGRRREESMAAKH